MMVLFYCDLINGELRGGMEVVKLSPSLWANKGLEISGRHRLAEVFCPSQTSGYRLPGKEPVALSVSVTSDS